MGTATGDMDRDRGEGEEGNAVAGADNTPRLIVTLMPRIEMVIPDPDGGLPRQGSVYAPIKALYVMQALTRATSFHPEAWENIAKYEAEGMWRDFREMILRDQGEWETGIAFGLMTLMHRYGARPVVESMFDWMAGRVR